MAFYHKLASAVYNNVLVSLRELESPLILTQEQIEDACIRERLALIKEYVMKGIIPIKDLLMSLNCINVDCAPIEKCNQCLPPELQTGTIMAHFQMPQVLFDYGVSWIEYIGTTDLQTPFRIYTSPLQIKYNAYRKSSRKKPYVYLDVAPNINGMLDGYIFNAPLIKQVSVIAVFKDPRQLEEWGCCPDENMDNLSFIDSEVEKRVTEKYIRYYRQTMTPIVQTV